MSIPVHCAHTALLDPNTLKPNPVNPNRHSAHQTPSLPDADPHSIRPRFGGRESKFLAETTLLLAILRPLAHILPPPPAPPPPRPPKTNSTSKNATNATKRSSEAFPQKIPKRLPFTCSAQLNKTSIPLSPQKITITQTL